MTIGLVSAVAVLTASAGAGATGAPIKRGIDVSTPTAVKQYLRSIGVSPSGVVIQRGVRNYAGARCPGKGWTCTSTSHPVVQFAAAGGKNSFQGTPGSGPVVQVAAASSSQNVAKCITTSGITQSCSINQRGTGSNTAIVVQIVTKTSGLTQNASQTARIIQTAGSGANTACVLQRTTIDGSTVAKKGASVNVTLDAHQSISITQDSASGGNTVQNASSTGNCLSGPLDQSQTLTSTATGSGSITQRQNAANKGPNMVLDIKQNQKPGFFGSASGPNSAAFNQTNTLTAVAVTPAGPVSQTQSSVDGGILANVNQDSTGVNTANATQTETQCEEANGAGGPLTCNTTADPPGYSLTQTQFGPVKKGDGDSKQTGGNPASTFTINQSSTQNNDTGKNQTNLVQGDCATSGNCMVTQTTNINGTSHTNTQSGQSVDTQISCSGSTCTSSGPTTTGDLTLRTDGLSVANTDVAEFGFGGMRGIGTGSITVSGVSGPVFHAFLYWNGPTNSTDPAVNAAVTFNGSAVTGTNIGVSGDNNWGFQNTQSYRADVTSLVTGNGAYGLAGFLKPAADINGVALIVFHDNGNSGDDRNVVLWNGNDSNCLTGGTPENWDETITGVPYQGGSASLDFVVADGQSFTDDAVLVNGSPLVPAGQIFDGDSTPPGVAGSLWDVESFDLTSFLATGSNNLHITTGTVQDCLSLVVAVANVPASAPVILAPTTAAVTAQKQSALAPTRQQTSGVTGASRLGGVSR